MERLRGAGFLSADTPPAQQFIPERLDAEARELAATAAAFLHREVLPLIPRLEAREPGLMDDLVRRAGEADLLGIEVPAQYGGIGADHRTVTLLAEGLSQYASFVATAGLHSGIGTWPVRYFGTRAQRERWLPRFASGATLSAYCLTEPGSGSDALSLVTKAQRDGENYRLTGTKQFISNGAISGVFTVFARLPDDGVTAFLVERGPGVTPGAEEKKLGLRGASTTSLALDAAPAELLGEPGKGHRVAFNCLNLGRLRLGSGCLGFAKQALEVATRYSLERKQFGKSLSEFGLIQQKLGDIAARIFGLESLVYRAAGCYDAALAGIDAEADGAATAIGRALAEFSVEASAAKVLGSEVQALAVDETVQVLGGYGYIEDYPAARFYRDARGNRLYEGTSEINRLLMAGTVLKRIAAGDLTEGPALEVGNDLLADARRVLAANRRDVWAFARALLPRFGAGLEQEQEVLGRFADMLMDLLALDASVARAEELVATTPESAWTVPALVTLLAVQSREALLARGRVLTARLGDAPGARELASRLAAEPTPADAIELARACARLTIDAAGYPLGWVGSRG